jgi:5-methylthioribose kinase
MQIHLGEANLPDYLRKQGLLAPGERAEALPCGDGNINWVRRVRISGGDPPRDRSWIVKQARPALERFPQYQVSTERILFEQRYGERARAFDRDGVLPEAVAFDPEARVRVLEDLGDAERLDRALARGADVSSAAAALGGFLGRVHAGTRDPQLANAFANDAMRRLHGDHIFVLPLRPNDFPLPDAVAARARALRDDAELVRVADAAYARYLEPSGALVHGDVQAANVLLAAAGPKLVDAEIAHVGDPAFDLGMLVAHLLLPALARGEPDVAFPAIDAAAGAYAAAHGPGAPRLADAARYAGLELLRRTIGAARVPAVEEPGPALAVLARAEVWIRRPPADLPSLRRG